MKRPLTPSQQRWLLQGGGFGLAAVLLAHTPRWLALWDWWQRAPLPNTVDAPAQVPALTPGISWEQRSQALADERAAGLLWKALRDRLGQQGLSVQQWQRLEGGVDEGGWPLAVQRARLVLQGDAAAWPLLPAAAGPAGGLWRLDRLNGQAYSAAAGQSSWRWQAEWSLALRPGTPGQDTPWPEQSQALPARVAVASPRPASGAQPGQATVPASDPVPAASAAASQATAALAQPPRVRRDGQAITDWPLAQLKWAGLWVSEGRQEAIFSAPGRLFRVRPGEAIGQDGHRWVGGDARRLVLQQPPVYGAAQPAEPAMPGAEQILIWETRP
jgi:hypothetical protein